MYSSVAGNLELTSGRVLTTFRGVVGPYLVSHGIAFSESATADPQWSGLMSYTSITTEFANVDNPSPRFWILWPGVACMLAVSFTGKPSGPQLHW